MKKYKLTNKVC
uniref:Uncharacterized protein n=1 Tax=Arundo donax TaxID=35708 RepID=A0A0A8YKV6_ARUDO